MNDYKRLRDFQHQDGEQLLLLLLVKQQLLLLLMD
jgi:hypothetical protein